MTNDQALKLLTQVCAVYRGTLEEHQALQEALKAVREMYQVAEAKPAEPEKKE